MARLLLALVLSLALAPPARADVPVPPGTQVAAMDGRVLYSRADGDRFRLVQRAGGVASDLPVAPSRRPFDVDLGVGASGRPVAVYSRCDPGCQVFAYDVAAGIEATFPRVNTRAQETLPSLHHGTLAFARDGRLHVLRLAGRRVRRVAGGTVTRTDSGAAGVLYAIEFRGADGQRVSEVRRLRADGRTEVLDAGAEPECCVTSRVVSPALGPLGPVWAVQRGGEEPGAELRGFGPERRLERAGAGAGVASLAQDEDGIHVIECPGSGTCLLRDPVRPAFEAADEVLASVAEPVGVTAYGRWAAWSERVAAGWRLVLRDARTGAVTRPDVPPARDPLDVDLGPGPDGRVQAVYSRARTVRALDVAGRGRERVLAGGTAPSRWRGRLAVLAGGRLIVRAGDRSRVVARDVLDAELYGPRVAYVRRTAGHDELWLDGRRIDRARRDRLRSPSFAEGALLWLRSRDTEPRASVLRSLDLSDGRRSERLAPLVTASYAAARDVGRRYALYVRGDGLGAGCARSAPTAAAAPCEVALARAPFPRVRG